jgi:hypothetical protein
MSGAVPRVRLDPLCLAEPAFAAVAK